jgi:predicted nuclease of predicted toxin-antitoxin system
MVKFAADENFNNRILRGIWRIEPSLDIVRVQDTQVAGHGDEAILAWAAKENRILLTHDFDTIINFAYERIRAGQPMAGVLQVNEFIPIGRVVDYIILAAGASLEGEWENQVRYVPLKE